MNNAKSITRIDLERCGAYGVMVRSWQEGWRLDDAGAPNTEEYIMQGSIANMLADYEKQGFAVWMMNAGKGRALRGKITRVDVLLTDDTWTLKKFCFGWHASTPPIEKKAIDTQTAKDVIQWLKDNKWTLFEFPGGARAFLGKPYPVRNRSGILALRRRFEAEQKNYNWDLAYCF